MKRILAVFVVLLAATPLFATNGYFIHGSSTAGKAMGGAGIALAQEPLDITLNPAAAVFLDREFYVSAALFSPDRSYDVIGSPSGQPGTFGLQPGSVRSKSNYFVMPSLAANFRPNDKTAWGISFFAHGGMNTDYRTNTFYGGDHTGVDLQQMFMTGTFARKIGTRQSIGINVIGAYQRFSANGLQAFTNFSSDPDCLTNRQHDHSYGLGARIGYLAELPRGFSIGASYSPNIKMRAFNAYCGLFAKDGRFDIPANATAGLAWAATKNLTFAGDVQRVNYSDVASVGNPLLPNLMTTPLGGDTGAGFGWRNMTTYKLGARWQFADAWKLRAGYSYGKQPIPDSEVLFNILAPAVIQNHYTLGVTREVPGAPSRFTVTVMYAPSNSVTGPNPLDMPGQQSIRLSMHELETEFSYTFRF